MNEEKCVALNFYAANQIMEDVLEDYQCYPERFLGEEPKDWFSDENPNPLYDLSEFSVDEIKEIATKMCKIDDNCPVEIEFTFKYLTENRYQEFVWPIMMRKIEERKQQLKK